jgi:beta propeller repeat protein
VEEEVVAPAETPEQTVTRLLMEREGVLRNQLRKEIETEFTKGCVTMDQVGYYCLKEGTPGTSMLAPSEAVTAVSIASGSVVPAQQVYITKGGVTSELTHDPWDSAFPATDLSGHSVVWQGNVNGRWQIFFANVSGTGTPEEIQVTHAAESNFNPRVEGNTVVWQGWVDGNWEIYRATRLDASAYLPADQSLPEEYVRLGVDRTWDLERITHNDTHDMFPAIAGGLITWQSFQDGTWSVFAYSTQMKTTTRLSQNGAKSENPRFSVTWDERGADGQTRLMGYDIATGKIVDISSEARQLPNDSKPYTPTAPITQNDQAALPITTGTTTATSTRADGDDGTTGNGLDI